MSDNLPEHSPLGASSAERWMNCPGSVTLIQALRSSPDYEEADPDYRRDGTQAHALAAHCLEGDIDCWQADRGQFPELTAEMMNAVQEYLDYVRSLPGKREVEVRVHVPEFHPQFYGTLDCVVSDFCVHVVDYKHGVGVVVDADDNPQLKYYAYGYIGDWSSPDITVKLTIVQPRGFHPDGTIRTWETTVGAIRKWAEEELRPAMDATKDMDYLALGPWCRFCPAKLVCPAYEGLAQKALKTEKITYLEAIQLQMLVNAAKEDNERRALAGEEIDGLKVVKKIAYRVFKPDTPLEARFGEDAWERKLRGPPDIEKLPGGKDFVAEFAYQPDNGLTVAPLTDKRKAVSPQAYDVEKYGDPAQYA